MIYVSAAPENMSDPTLGAATFSYSPFNQATYDWKNYELAAEKPVASV